MCGRIDNSVENEYAEGLAKEKEAAKSKKARDNILRFYHKNKLICNIAYQYYAGYNDNKAKYVKESIHLTKEKFIKRLKSRKILILTANPIERGVLIRWLSEKKGSPLEAYMVGRYSYNVYNAADQDPDAAEGYSIIHVDPGETGEEGARRAINHASKLFQPDYIIALGICYGFNMDKYSIGYVFISESVTTFRVNFRDDENQSLNVEPVTEYEERPAHNLVQSVRERIMYTMARNILSDEKQPLYARTEVGKFLSANHLVSSPTFKRALMAQYGKTKPKPLGGEMEGPGILKSDIVQEEGFSNWLIVKSICDWGEMKNDIYPDKHKSEQIKDILQAFAMTNTCSIFDKILVDLCEV